MTSCFSNKIKTENKQQKPKSKSEVKSKSKKQKTEIKFEFENESESNSFSYSRSNTKTTKNQKSNSNQKQVKQNQNFNLKRELERNEFELDEVNNKIRQTFDQMLQLDMEKYEILTKLNFFENYLVYLDSQTRGESKSFSEIKSMSMTNNYLNFSKNESFNQKENQKETHVKNENEDKKKYGNSVNDISKNMIIENEKKVSRYVNSDIDKNFKVLLENNTLQARLNKIKKNKIEENISHFENPLY